MGHHRDTSPCAGARRCQCCKHASCGPLKERSWCRDWLFLQWEASRIIWPSEMLDELREKLGHHEFRFYANRKPDGKRTIFQILLRIESSERGGRIPSVLMESSVFDRRHTQVWPLRCCWHALKWDTKAWTVTLRRGDNSLLFGDAGLLNDMEEEIEEPAGKAPSVVG